ncbi:MAG: AraC family transcriptional regulator [Muribaculaceae bacterium]|nr:AraC family transcriptional regulator [Muribaculaceae bacterium]
MSYIDLIKENGYLIADVKSEQFKTLPVETRFDVVMLCHSGIAEIEFNMKRLRLAPHMCVVFSNVLYGRATMASEDFKVTVLVMDRKFALDATVGIPTELLHKVIEQPVHIIEDNAEWEMLNKMMEIIKLNMYCMAQPQQQEMVGVQFRAMLLTLASNAMQSLEFSSSSFTMSDTYFRNFITLIDAHIKEHHEVAFYAEQLHITPKYLSEICKQKSGYKAKEILSSVLVANIKKDIMVSGKSMKSLAYEYHFADQSSLGKFFRKMTGKSPVMYRKEK